jgi:hypothetical protein
MKRTTVAATSILLFSSALGCGLQPAPSTAAGSDPQSALKAEDAGKHKPLTAEEHRRRGQKGSPSTLAEEEIGRGGETLPMKNFGGRVMTAATNAIYYIWYGNWTGDTAPAILDDLARNLGGSPHYAINSTYFSADPNTGTHTPVPTTIAFGGETYDPGSQGPMLHGDTGDAAAIVTHAITTSALPLDTNGIYLVLTANGIMDPNYCTHYCGYHSRRTIENTDIVLGLIGNPTNCGGCADPFGSPNNNPGADGMASSITHEVSEMVTDPHYDAWKDGVQGEEVADKCRGYYGANYITSNGAHANTHLGAHDYMLEMLWMNGPDGMCAQQLTPATLLCVDGTKDGSEPDVDCGGVCTVCEMGQHCSVDGDCDDSKCLSGTCTSYCKDGQQDNDETDLDCGGHFCIATCALGKHCSVNLDCASGECQGGTCSASFCTDGKQDGHETGVDCGGGTCAPCGLGQGCSMQRDCAVGQCILATCNTLYCQDFQRDGDETDVDCGDPLCGITCALGQHCTANANCASAVCSVGGLCVANDCLDGRKDDQEGDVDCGGTCASKCALGQFCTANADCASAVCSASGVCVANDCVDGRRDDQEGDIDCGGTCANRCALGQSCGANADCASVICSVGGLCVATTCADGRVDNHESDVDCGGGTCGGCGLDKNCYMQRDCAVGQCLFGSCSTIYCGDSVKDYDESDVDCGGPNCSSRCANGLHCSASSDCTSGDCQAGKCVPTHCTDGVREGAALESDLDCGGPDCAGCGLGKNCYMQRDCAVGQCLFGSCSTIYCGDSVKDYDETDVDCGGPSCGRCAPGRMCATGSDCLSGNCTSGHCQ